MSDRPSLLIRRARVLLPDGSFQVADVSVRGGTIAQIGDELGGSAGADAGAAADRVIDAEGLTLLPGVIDPQVHFRDPGLEHKEDLATASAACVHGGVTSFLEMPNTKPLTTTQETLTDKLAIAARKSLVNYGFFIGATPACHPDLITATPTPGIKIFMGSMHGPLLVSTEAELEPIFAQGRSPEAIASDDHGRLIAVHAENHARILARREQFAAQVAAQADPTLHSQIQDVQAALEATQLALKLSKKYRRRLHILHLSTGAEAELLRHDKPAWVTAEVTPQHLLLNTEAYHQIGSRAQMNPPLRSPEDNATLWQALLDGVIDFIATDHAPHTLAEKAQPYPQTPSGMPGVETSLPLMLTQAVAGRCTVPQVSRWMSTNVAAAYGIPRKGAIAPGWDADLILVDLDRTETVHPDMLQTKCRWSPFEGWKLTGWPQYTIVGGHVAYDRGTLNTAVRGQALTFTGS